MKELSVIVITYNRKQDLKICLTSVVQQRDDIDLELIVFDNNSSDGTADMVASEFPNVTLMRGKSNLGLVKAINESLRHCSGQYILLLNDDTILRPNALRLLLDFMIARKDAGIAASKLLYPDGTNQLTNRTFPTPMNFLFGRQSVLTRWFPNNRFAQKYLRIDDLERTDPYEVDWVSLACVIARREVIEQIGPLDEDYFIYWIDADWCRCIKNAGWKIYCVPQAEVIHMEENRPGRKRSPKGIIDFHRGVYLYYTKHHLKFQYSPVRWLVLGLLTFRACALILVNFFRKKDSPSRRIENLA